MKLFSKFSSAEGPIRFAPQNTSAQAAHEDHIVAIPQEDTKKFLHDIAALFQSKIVDMRDRLIGASFAEDRVLYFGKRSEWVEQLECKRTIPFVIELIRTEGKVWLNKLPVSDIRTVGGQTIFGLSYGDAAVEYHFPIIK